ncbi:uncharacterized protein si:ch211-243a20.4 [Astyanax mexicanus]|uniref:uncharacterized protein si:ch211-243a20.4 n=1 Tax=Astyanax mexicanus TaxID=7994 RepID=UPI000440EA0B|nr:uncharacterized protein si:ch211-243a20.4 [Astyanax mexicanus]
MFVVKFGIFCICLLCCCNRSEAKELVVKNRTSVALAGETLSINIMVTVPVNSSGTKVSCKYKNIEVWRHTFKHVYSVPTPMWLWANISMPNSSFSGEYSFNYQASVLPWLVLVRDVGYVKPGEPLHSDVIALLTVTLILVLFSIIGSVFVVRWHKAPPQTEVKEDGVKGRERQSSVGVTTQVAHSESVYSSLEPRPVSIYDVLNVDQVRRESTEKRTSQETAKTSQAEEGVFESVYENL